VASLLPNIFLGCIISHAILLVIVQAAAGSGVELAMGRRVGHGYSKLDEFYLLGYGFVSIFILIDLLMDINLY
jgi:hypothetical protein